jgi:hypothetical protein
MGAGQHQRPIEMTRKTVQSDTRSVRSVHSRHPIKVAPFIEAPQQNGSVYAANRWFHSSKLQRKCSKPREISLRGPSPVLSKGWDSAPLTHSVLDEHAFIHHTLLLRVTGFKTCIVLCLDNWSCKSIDWDPQSNLGNRLMSSSCPQADAASAGG